MGLKYKTPTGSNQGKEVELCVPFCGGKTSDLTSDELYSEHLGVLCVADQSKYLQGDVQHFKTRTCAQVGP